MRKLFTIIPVLVLLVLFCGCSDITASDADYSAEQAADIETIDQTDEPTEKPDIYSNNDLDIEFLRLNQITDGIWEAKLKITNNSKTHTFKNVAVKVTLYEGNEVFSTATSTVFPVNSPGLAPHESNTFEANIYDFNGGDYNRVEWDIISAY